MNAHTVWTGWRRILRSDVLVDAVLQPGADTAIDSVDDALKPVLAAYAADRQAADFMIGMYRRGLVRNALSALLLAPLTRRLIHAGGIDTGELAQAYVASIGYRDDGPNFYRAAASLLAFAGTLPAFASASRQAAIAFDGAVIAHMQALGRQPPSRWPRPAGAAPIDDGPYVANRACTVHSSQCDLTDWLEHPDRFDPAQELPPGEHHWLVSVADAESPYSCAELSPRAARAFLQLAAPHTVSQLAAALDLSPAAAGDILQALLASAAIEPCHKD